MHWRNHLKFPEEARLTPEAKDLICRLMCDVDHRLGTGGADQIKVWCGFCYKCSFFCFPHVSIIYVHCKLTGSGSSLVQRYCMGQTLWDGGCIQARSQWRARYSKLFEVWWSMIPSSFFIFLFYLDYFLSLIIPYKSLLEWANHEKKDTAPNVRLYFLGAFSHATIFVF